MTVSETASDTKSAKVTTSAWSANSWPAMPCTNTMGKNTATVVSVDATMAPETSPAPWTDGQGHTAQ